MTAWYTPHPWPGERERERERERAYFDQSFHFIQISWQSIKQTKVIINNLITSGLITLEGHKGVLVYDA